MITAIQGNDFKVNLTIHEIEDSVHHPLSSISILSVKISCGRDTVDIVSYSYTDDVLSINFPHTLKRGTYSLEIVFISTGETHLRYFQQQAVRILEATVQHPFPEELDIIPNPTIYNLGCLGIAVTDKQFNYTVYDCGGPESDPEVEYTSINCGTPLDEFETIINCN